VSRIVELAPDPDKLLVFRLNERSDSKYNLGVRRRLYDVLIMDKSLLQQIDALLATTGETFEQARREAVYVGVLKKAIAQRYRFTVSFRRPSYSVPNVPAREF